MADGLLWWQVNTMKLKLMHYLCMCINFWLAVVLLYFMCVFSSSILMRFYIYVCTYKHNVCVKAYNSLFLHLWYGGL